MQNATLQVEPCPQCAHARKRALVHALPVYEAPLALAVLA